MIIVPPRVVPVHPVLLFIGSTVYAKLSFCDTPLGVPEMVTVVPEIE